MMKNNNLENSIVLLGPKQVGKSFFSRYLMEEPNTPNMVISSDLLTNLLVFNMSGNWSSLVESSELKELGKTYKTLFNFKELEPIIESLARCQQTDRLSDKARKVAMSYWKARLLEDATRMIKEPYILDAGADIGAVINLSDAEKKNLSNFFFMPYEVVEHRMSDFLKQFGAAIYMQPEQSYKTLQGRAQDDENAIYLESGKSYLPYATHIAECEKIYHTGKPKEVAVKEVIKSLNLGQTPSTFGE